MYIKFKYKLLAVLCMILLMSSIVISGIWYKYSKDLIVENVYQSTNLILKERNRAFSASIEDVAFQTRNLTYNNPIVDRFFHNQWQDDYLNNQAVHKFKDAVTATYVNNPMIQSIELGNHSGDVFFLGQRLGLEVIAENEFQKLLEPLSGSYVLVGAREQTDFREQIMLYRNILYYGKNIGYCAVTFAKDQVAYVYEDAFPKETVLTVKGEADSFLYASDNYQASLENQSFVKLMDSVEDGHKISRDGNGKEWLLLGDAISGSGAQVRVAIPVDSLLGDIKGRFANIFMVTGLLMGILFLVVLLASKWIGRNVDVLAGAIKDFSKGSLDTTIQLNGKDEFGKVAEAFNTMTREIKKLMEDIKKKEQEKVSLEIRSLQGQINMHFLFNTLNTIKNLCYVQRVTNVEHLVDSLMQLLHVSMEQEEEYIELEKELLYVKHYLEIYQYKSVSAIQYFMDIEPGILDAAILKFSVQPIVENAIIHGLEGNEQGEEGVIYIKAIQEGQDLEITVTDNGKGFDTAKIPTFNGIGWSNTQKRIKIHFGEQYGMTAESIEGISTSVKIRMPYRRIEHETKTDKDSYRG